MRRYCIAMVTTLMIAACGISEPELETYEGSCARSVMNNLGYCPGERLKREAGWHCWQTGNNHFDDYYFKCERQR